MKLRVSPSLNTFFNEFKLFRISIPKFPETFRRLTAAFYFATGKWSCNIIMNFLKCRKIVLL